MLDTLDPFLTYYCYYYYYYHYEGAVNVGLQYWEPGWRISYGGSALFSIILGVAMIFCPESPRWLVDNGRKEEARQVR